MPELPDNLTFLKTPELAALLRVPPATVHKWRHVGRGPRGIRVGRNVLYSMEDVRAFLAEREALEDGARD